MSVMCVSICMCGFPVRLRVERREVGWGGVGGGACVLAFICVCVCVACGGGCLHACV